MTGNIMGGPNAPAFATAYPPNNSYPATLPSPLPAGVGVDMNLVRQYTACAVSGQCAKP